jgi:hypothetical protein
VILSWKVQALMIFALLGFPFLTFLNLPNVDESGRLWRAPLLSPVVEVGESVPSSTSVVVSGLVVGAGESVPSSTSVVVSGLVVEVGESVPSSTSVVVSGLVVEVGESVPSSTSVVEEKPVEIETGPESRSQTSDAKAALIEDELTKSYIWDEVYLASWPSIDMWDELALCESGQNWEIDTGNGYFGGLQFSVSTWRYVGGLASPSASSRMEQIYRGNLLWETQGWKPWPGCRSKLGWAQWQVIL